MFSFPFFLSLARPGSKDVLVCVCGPRGAMPARQASGAARTGSVRASCDYSGVGGEIPACRELPSETINERLSVVNDALSRTLSKSNPAVCGVVCVCCVGLSSERLSNVGCGHCYGEWRARVMSVERLLGERRESESAYV